MSTARRRRRLGGSRRSGREVAPTEGGQLLVEFSDDLELLAEAFGGEPLGHGEAGRVVGEGHPLVAETAGGEGHLLDGRTAVGPVGVRVAVAPQGGQKLGRLRTQGG